MALPGQIRQLMAFGPSRADHIPALRIAASVGVPLLVLLCLHRTDLAVYASFGAFTSLYARHQPLLSRFRHQCWAGLMVLACIGLGILLSEAGAGPWVLVTVCALVAAAGAVATASLSMRPPGSVFFIFATGAIGSISSPAPVGQALLVAVAAALWSVLAGLLGVLLGEGVRGPVAPVPEHSGLDAAGMLRYGLSFLCSTFVAGAIGQGLGISRPYWAMVAAAAAIAAPNVLARLHRSVHRIVGTFGGIFVTAFILSQSPQTWHLVVWVILFQFLAEVYVGRNYAFAQLFITPLALLMAQVAHPVPARDVLTARLAETAIGSAVAFLMVLLLRTPTEREADTQAIPVISVRRGPGRNHRPGSADQQDAETPSRPPLVQRTEDSD